MEKYQTRLDALALVESMRKLQSMGRVLALLLTGNLGPQKDEQWRMKRFVILWVFESTGNPSTALLPEKLE